jgi:glycosyltransferase involved in cell wall biosynthesis
MLQLALASVLESRVRPEATVIVVDGPVNADLQIVLNEFEAIPGVTLLQLPCNLGLAAALNAGLERVTTNWVLRADADDVNTPERLEIQAQFANDHPEVELFGGAIDEIDPTNGLVISRRSVPLSHDDIVRRTSSRNPFNHMTVAFKVERVRAVGGYPRLHLREDYGLWAHLLSDGVRSANLPNVLVLASTGRDMYRRRGGWRYAVGEWSLQLHLIRCGLKSPLSAFLHGTIRSLVFLLPAILRGLVYKRFLRSRAS